MPLPLAKNLLLVLIIASLFSGCAGSFATTVVVNEPTSTLLPTKTNTPQPLLENTPVLATPTPPEPTSTPFSRPPSGWTYYSNPDFVQGVALYGRQLWAATLGGVVTWDLDTEMPKLYTTRDGLVEIQSNDVVYCAGPEERIFVAHSSGMLSAFDLKLKKWSRIPITFDGGGTLKGVRTLFCDSANQRLMAGSADGLGILDLKTNHWRRIGAQEGLKTNTISAIDVVGQAIWLAAVDKSAFMIMGKTVFSFNAASGFPSGSVYDLAVASDQSIWFGYSTGLVHYHDKKWNSYGSQTASGIPFHSVDHVEIGPDKRVWISSSEEGICPFNPVTLFCSTVYPSTHGAPITDLIVSPDNVAYAGTNGAGVLILDKEGVRHLSFNRQQLMSNDVLDIAQSPDGNLWVATDRGVNFFNPAHLEEPWKTITPQRNQLAFSRVTRLLPAANGMWFFYDKEAQASFFDGSSWTLLDSFNGLSGIISDALIDQRGYVWFATNQGINVWDGTVMRKNSPAEDMRGNVYHALFEKDGEVWAGTDRGLLHYQRYQWVLALPDMVVNTIAPDVQGGLLLGTDQGLVRYDGSQSFLWIINLGDEVLAYPKVTSIAWDGNHQLWVGTDGDGLLRYNGKRWEQFNTVSGLPTNQIRKITADRLGTVWISAVTGEGGGALVRFVP
jgi:ligand-binding sensor domain-containing protein